MFGQCFARSIQKYFGLIVLPVQMHYSFVGISTGVWAYSFYRFYPVNNSVLNLYIRKQRGEYMLIIYIRCNRKVTREINIFFPFYLNQVVVQFRWVGCGKTL